MGAFYYTHRFLEKGNIFDMGRVWALEVKDKETDI